MDALIDFGAQPPSNRFERADERNPDQHPLVMGQCRVCGLVQLIEPMPPMMVKSRFPWITYNEPEGHLDNLVARLNELPGMTFDSRLVGLTYLDDSTLDRFRRLGYSTAYRLDARLDLGLDDPCAGMESVQASVSPAVTSHFISQRGLADLVVVRRVLEHAHDPRGFLRALCDLVKPGGYLVVEIPDCTKFMNVCDYSFVWEEHISYFRPETLTGLVRRVGFALIELLNYSYPFEDSLVAIIRNEPSAAPATGSEFCERLLERGAAFARGFPERRAQARAALETWMKDKRRVALLGAGHLGTRFINFYGLQGMIHHVVDDASHKQGLLMPGSRVPIRGSSEMANTDICLLTLNPESERKVLDRHRAFVDRGGQFYSIFAVNPSSVYQAAGT